jgi:archaemetzincin
MILLLFRDKNCLAEFCRFKGALEECYGNYGLQVQDRGYLHVPLEGPKLDAAKLLKYLGQITGNSFSLWLLDCELYYPEIGNVIGCSTDRSALISAFYMEFDTVAKEAIHEVGHILGLDHCRCDNCVMSLSNSAEQVRAKSSQLCEFCSIQLRNKE